MSTVIFDCDGVLVDTESISAGVASTLLKESGLDLEPDEVARMATGYSDKAIWDMFQEELGRPLPSDIGQRHRDLVDEKFRRDLSPMPGVVETIDRLLAANIAICVASSGTPEKMEITLGVTGLSKFFSNRIFSVTQVAKSKPAPDVYLFAAQSMGAAPEQCVVIEDSLPGVQAGLAAGMKVYGFCPNGDVWGLQELGVQTFNHMANLPELIGLS